MINLMFVRNVIKIARRVVEDQTIFAYYAQRVPNGLVILYHHAEVHAQRDTLNRTLHFAAYVIQHAKDATVTLKQIAHFVYPDFLSTLLAQSAKHKL